MNDQERNEEEPSENGSDYQMTLSANKRYVENGEVVVLTLWNQNPNVPVFGCDICVFHDGVAQGRFVNGSFLEISDTGRFSMIKLDSNNLEFKIDPFKVETDVGKWTMQYKNQRFPPVTLSNYAPFAPSYAIMLAPAITTAVAGFGAYCLVDKWRPKNVPFAPVYANMLGAAITTAVTGFGAYCLVDKWRPKNVDTRDAVEEALQQLKNNNLINDFKKHEVKIMEVLKESAKTEEKLTKEMFRLVDDKSVEDVEKEMTAIIGQDRVNLIKKAFCIETYQMKLVQKSNGQTVVQVHRGGAQFRPERHLKTITDIEDSHMLQCTSIVVEIYFFVLSCVDIKVDLNNVEMEALVQEVEVYVRRTAFQDALNKFLEEWNQGGILQRAKAIFYLLKNTYFLGIFWNIVKLIHKDMSTWEKTRAVVEVVLMIAAAMTTEGLALIARIALAVDSAVYLEQKLINISQFMKHKKNSLVTWNG